MPMPPLYRLFDAIAKNDQVAATQALNEGVDLDATPPIEFLNHLVQATIGKNMHADVSLRETGAFHWAMTLHGENALPWWEWLLNHGARLDRTGPNAHHGDTLDNVLVCRYDRLAVWLMEHGLPIDAEYGRGMAVVGLIHRAAGSDCLGMLQWLINAGVSMETPDTQGGTPLWHAALGGAEKTMIWLAEHGADWNAFSRWHGMTAKDAMLAQWGGERWADYERDWLKKNAAIVDTGPPKGPTRRL